MTFKPAIWYPITVVLSAFNLVAVGFTAAEPWHAATHAALALGFGLWAQRLRQGLRGSGLQGGSERSEEHTSELQSLAYLVCRLLLEKKKKKKQDYHIEYSKS